MFKLISILIEAVYWLMLFLCPVIVLGIAAFVVYLKYNNTAVAIIIGTIGTILGIWFAERIRRKYGTSNFYGRLLRTPELENKESGDGSEI